MTQKAAGCSGTKEKTLPQVQAVCKLLIHIVVRIQHIPMVLDVSVEERDAGGGFGSPPYMKCSASPQDFGAKSCHPLQIITLHLRNESWPGTGP